MDCLRFPAPSLPIVYLVQSFIVGSCQYALQNVLIAYARIVARQAKARLVTNRLLLGFQPGPERARPAARGQLPVDWSGQKGAIDKLPVSLSLSIQVPKQRDNATRRDRYYRPAGRVVTRLGAISRTQPNIVLFYAVLTH